MQQNDVALTSLGCHFNIMCPLGHQMQATLLTASKANLAWLLQVELGDIVLKIVVWGGKLSIFMVTNLFYGDSTAEP